MSEQSASWRAVLAEAERDANEAILDAIEAVEEARRQLERLGATGMSEDLTKALRGIAELHEWSTAHKGWARGGPVMTHPANTISDAVWRSISTRSLKAPSGSAERARRVRLAGLQYRAAKKGWN